MRYQRTVSSFVVCLAAATALYPSTALHGQGRDRRTMTDLVAGARDGVILYSADDGATWTTITPTNGYVNGVVSDNRGNFVAVGSDGLILLSEDGAATWQTMHSGTEAGLSAVAWDDAESRFVAVGAEGTVLISTDGGHSWVAGNTGGTHPLMSVATNRAGTWVVSGAQGLILYSTDGGESWTETAANTGAHMNDVTFVGDERWVGVGQVGRHAYSSDGGRTWTPVRTAERTTLEGVVVNEDGAVVAAGWNGVIARSDSGESWTPVESGTGRRLTAVTRGRNGALVAVGWRGTVTISTDGGASWKATENLTRKHLQTVAFNRLPDLSLSPPTLDDECRVIVQVSNRGPANLPAEAWENEATILRLELDEEPIESIAIGALDSARELTHAGGRVASAFAFQVATDTVSVRVAVDPNGIVAEASEGNNLRVTQLVCER